jgi:hypothetical protein
LLPILAIAAKASLIDASRRFWWKLHGVVFVVVDFFLDCLRFI